MIATIEPRDLSLAERPRKPTLLHPVAGLGRLLAVSPATAMHNVATV